MSFGKFGVDHCVALRGSTSTTTFLATAADLGGGSTGCGALGWDLVAAHPFWEVKKIGPVENLLLRNFGSMGYHCNLIIQYDPDFPNRATNWWQSLIGENPLGEALTWQGG